MTLFSSGAYACCAPAVPAKHIYMTPETPYTIFKQYLVICLISDTFCTLKRVFSTKKNIFFEIDHVTPNKFGCFSLKTMCLFFALQMRDLMKANGVGIVIVRSVFKLVPDL